MADCEPSNPKTVCAADARVVSCCPPCREHVLIEMALPEFPASVPGQFLQLLCRPVENDCDAALREWPEDGFPSLKQAAIGERTAFLRRPFSIADHWTGPDGQAHLCVISHSVGAGTRWLARLRPGDVLNVTGPLGRGFEIPNVDTPVVLIGGGVGIPPLLYLARHLHALKRHDVTVILGARTRELLPVQISRPPAADGRPARCVVLPGGADYGTIVASDDGSIGWRGLVTDAFRTWHDGTSRTGAIPPLVFACGPEQMLQAVAALTRELGLACQLCIERSMGCGMGTCLSCVVRRRDAKRAPGWRWALACTDGPVFERDELLDYDAVSRA